METLKNIVTDLDRLLEPEKFKDYAPNGMQVEGREQVTKIVTGVTASRALIERAIESKADLILVHHGYFWPGEDPCIVGMKKKRFELLIKNDITLLAYHLPLDAHPVLGNNAQLALKLGFEVEKGLGSGADLAGGLVGRLIKPCDVDTLSARIKGELNRAPLVISEHLPTDKLISRIAWCSGAAQGFIGKAVAQGVDAYLTGEVSEQTVHEAREHNIGFFSAGHHATERYGVQAVGEYLADKFELSHQYIEVDNPV